MLKALVTSRSLLPGIQPVLRTQGSPDGSGSVFFRASQRVSVGGMGLLSYHYLPSASGHLLVSRPREQRPRRL